MLFLYIYLAACLNYNTAIQETKKCEGSDLSIQEIMVKHGFNQDIFDTITEKDKIIAIFNIKTTNNGSNRD